MSEYAQKINIALKDMTPENRMDAYIETVKHPPMNSLDISKLKIYKDIFQKVYPAEFAEAEKAAKAAAKAAATELARETLVAYDKPEKVLNFDNYAITEFDRPSIYDLLKYGLKGGKTRRNRRGRGRGRRGRGRRSLKHYSKRR